jgi:aminopeptidase N
MLTQRLVLLLALLLLAVPGTAASADSVVTRYDLEVVVHPEKLSLRAALDVTPGPLRLELVPEMEVKAAKVGGRDVPVTRNGSVLSITLPASKEALRLEIEAEGSPRSQFSKQRGGFLRSAVTPERTWIRSQLPWYPRVTGPAAYRIRVDVPKGWRVRTAGRAATPVEEGDRAVWTYETSSPIRNAGLVAGPYAVKEAEAGGGSVLEAWTFPGDEEGATGVLNHARSAFEHYRERFGEVEVGRFSLVEMTEAFGKGSGYGEDGYVLLGRGAFLEGGSAPWAASLVAHEVSHTWWGREVSFSEFASESLACYATHGFLEATAGEDAARRERLRAVERVVAAAGRGKEVALPDIRGFGGGMDPETYRVHAYEKGMMLFVMVEDVIGREKLERCLRDFVTAHRGAVVGYQDLRKALASAGSMARRVIEQWEKPGIPRLAVEHETKGRRAKVTVTQQGTERPFKMTVPVVATCGGKEVRGIAKLSGAKTTLTLSLPGEPESIVLDPDYRLLVAAPRSAIADPKKIIDEAFDVVSNPGDRDPKRCEHALSLLKRLLAAGAGDYEGLCHTGIGRCLFRLGRLEEAKEVLEKALALGGGGPFHRRWINLRLGCIADLRKQRKKAIEHYEWVVSRGTDKDYTVRLAKRFLEKPYRE